MGILSFKNQRRIRLGIPSKHLIDFHRRFCSDVPIDSPVVVIRLLEEISKLDNGKER